MKFLITILIIAVISGIVAVSACNGCNSKRGNGQVIKQDRSVTSFSKISIEGIFPVVLSQNGGPEFVKVEADENLQEYILVRNDGDELIVETEDNVSIRKSKRLKVFINLKNISELNYKSVGSLITHGKLKLDSLEINSESVGKVDLDIDARFLRANLNSVGVTNLQGKVTEARINNKSVGALNAYDLKTQTMMLHNTSVGTAEIYADSAFFIRSSALGNVYYKGNGEVKELKSEGIGRVQKANL
jgi:hypothetical protein